MGTGRRGGGTGALLRAFLVPLNPQRSHEEGVSLIFPMGRLRPHLPAPVPSPGPVLTTGHPLRSASFSPALCPRVRVSGRPKPHCRPRAPCPPSRPSPALHTAATPVASTRTEALCGPQDARHWPPMLSGLSSGHSLPDCKCRTFPQFPRVLAASPPPRLLWQEGPLSKTRAPLWPSTWFIPP